MTILRLAFAGVVKKAEHRTAAGKSLVEVSICKKNRTKQGEPDAFTWIRVTLWEPAEFQAPKLVKGSFIAGTGDLTARSYEGKDGKATSLEVSCRSFDVEVSDGGDAQAAPAQSAPAPRPTRPAPTAQSETEEPPF
jgi:single-stranded DNA-binding protein